jgi:DNA polymerase
VSLALDARQRAMLAEMGVRVFLPVDASEPAAETVAGARAPAIAAPVPPPTAVRAAVPQPAVPRVQERAAQPSSGTVDVEAVDWPAFEAAVRDWAASAGRKTVIGLGDLQPAWLCVGDPPDEEEERQGVPFAGERGQLLDNMLQAVGVSRARGAYFTNCWKSRPPEGGASPEEVARQEAFLRRQVQLLQPRMILAMGRFAVQALLQSAEPPGRLRGRLHRYLDVPVVVTYPPVSLLRTPADKAKAWADLCLAQAALRENS